MKIFLLQAILFLSLPLNATETKTTFTGFPGNCGEYKISGIIRIIEKELVVVVNEKTQSQVILTLPIPEQARLGMYLDRAMFVNLLLKEKFDGTKGKVDSVVSGPEARVPDPLKPADTGFLLVKESPCTPNGKN